jgi:hypothetical protein
MNKLIPVDSSADALTTIHRLCKIAMKAHRNSPSPVDIKLELEIESPLILEQIIEDAQRIMIANGVQHIPYEL